MMFFPFQDDEFHLVPILLKFLFFLLVLGQNKLECWYQAFLTN